MPDITFDMLDYAEPSKALKADDKTELGRLRLQFCEGTPYQSPYDAIKNGARTIDEWITLLNTYRIKHPTFTRNATSQLRPAEVLNRTEIIEFLQAHHWALSAVEIAKALNKSQNPVRDILEDLAQEGVVSVTVRIRGTKKSVQMYQIKTQ